MKEIENKNSRKKLMKRDYRKLFDSGFRIHSPHFLFFATAFPEKIVKVSISKKVGMSVLRNKYKRWMRIFIRDFKFPSPVFILVVCRKNFSMDFAELRVYFEKFLWEVTKKIG